MTLKDMEQRLKAQEDRDKPDLHTPIVAQPMTTVDGDKAKGQFIWLGRINDPRKFGSLKDGGDDIMALSRLGRYDMEYKKVDGKWKMSDLKFTLGSVTYSV